MSRLLDGIGRLIARYLQKPVHGYEPFTPSDPDALRQSLEPGDVLLVEGNNNISGVIKYLTQSTWPHSALYVGPVLGRVGLTEADCASVCAYANGLALPTISRILSISCAICFRCRCRSAGAGV